MSASQLERRAFLGLVAAGMVGAYTSRAAFAQSAPTAVSPIERLDATLLSVMKAGRAAPFAQRFDTVAAAIDQAFDLDAVLKTSVGLHWANLSPEQQAQLQAAFRRYTIANYVANFDSYSGEKFQVDPQTRMLGNGDQIVTTTIVSNTGSPTVLSYVMRQTPVGWKAIDVLADGTISRVAVQRSDFRSLLNQGGGTALVASLQRKVADLSHGTLA